MLENLKRILTGFKSKKIIVWGDLILDEYIYTTTGRISREAPVLVAEFDSNEYILGGAGNVVMNIHALGAVPIPVALIGTNADEGSLFMFIKQYKTVDEYRASIRERWGK